MQIFFHRRDFNPEVSTWKLYLRQQAPGWQRGYSRLKIGRMTIIFRRMTNSMTINMTMTNMTMTINII